MLGADVVALQCGRRCPRTASSPPLGDAPDVRKVLLDNIERDAEGVHSVPRAHEPLPHALYDMRQKLVRDMKTAFSRLDRHANHRITNNASIPFSSRTGRPFRQGGALFFLFEVTRAPSIGHAPFAGSGKAGITRRPHPCSRP